MLGISTAVGTGTAAMRVIDVQENTPAARSGFKIDDVIVSFDGVPMTGKETFNRLVAAKRWGDSAIVVVRRGSAEVTIPVAFRRVLDYK
jgi:S1-C subfamily serine protease